MQLEILEDSQSSAAGNMAGDQLLLEAYPSPHVVRFRHYSWQKPAYSFGKLQSYTMAKAQLKSPLLVNAQWVRRPSAGGLVEHGHDWTYSLVIPRAHPLALAPARESYNCLHQALQKALQGIGVFTQLQACQGKQNSKPSRSKLCFKQADVSDLIDENGLKIAGAAQQRTQAGLLLQGSIAKRRLTVALHLNFKQLFCKALKESLKLTSLQNVSTPRYPQDLYQASLKLFASEQWLKKH